MPFKGKESIFSLLLLAALVLACNSSSEVGNKVIPAGTNANANNANKAEMPKTTASSDKPGADGLIPSGEGVEKEKPAAGTGNVQGKVFYNEQPAAGVEVKLCETFSRFVGGCGGQTYTTKTDAGGEYLIKGVPPKVYEGLVVKVFNSNYYVFATSGIVQSAKYQIEDGKTFFAPDTHLFKNDLKVVSPKAGAKVGANNIEVRWSPYPDAAYYKMSLYADSGSGAEAVYDFIGRRVDGDSFTTDKPLKPGSYTCRVEAYNGNDIKLAQSSGDVKFTVTGGAAQ